MTRNRLALKLCLETIEDTKGVNGYRKSEDRQYNDPQKKGRTMILDTLHRKLQIAQDEPNKRPNHLSLVIKVFMDIDIGLVIICIIYCVDIHY